jgi:hypothetical protein
VNEQRLMTMDEFMGWAPPVPRSPAETMELAFREEDRQFAQERKRSAELVATRQTDRRDAAEMAAFMGHEVPTHADVLARFAAAADEADRWQSYKDAQAAKRAEQAREQAQLERVAELEDELATTATRAEQLGRHFHEAVEGWGRARQEAASFRDAHYRSYYR